MHDFPLSAVRLGPSPFLHAQQVDLEYLLSLDPDRLLAPVLREAGLEPRKASYGNWENSGLDGHTLGHVLTATALMAQGTDDPRPAKRLTYLVTEIARAQDHLGTGYVGGVPHGQDLWARIASGNVEPDSFGLNGAWVPWYNLHKLFAGLLDAYLRTDNQLAFSVVTKLANWWVGISQSMSDELFEAMLRTEFGGMNTSFADLAALTGDPEHLRLAHRFSDQRLLQPLLNREDPLTGMHANTQIAKVVGYQRLAQVVGTETPDTETEAPSTETAGSGTSNTPTGPELAGAARFFFDEVTTRRTLSFGGNSVREHFPETLAPAFESEQGPESCNTTNMLNLSRLLFLSTTSDTCPDPAIMDFYERATFNHILSSQHPGGGLVYFTPARPDHYRVYSSAQDCFWCCVGTGLENHGRYGELIYSRKDSSLFINLAIPSTLTWPERGLTVRQTSTLLDSDTQVIEILDAPLASQPTTIHVRIPLWAAGPISIHLNGDLISANTAATPAAISGAEPVLQANSVDGYLSITRAWVAGDVLSVHVPKALTAEPAPDGSPWVSFRYGPTVLAQRTGATDLVGLHADDSRMGHVASGPLHPLAKTPVLVGATGTELAQAAAQAGLTYTPDPIATGPGPDHNSSTTLEPFWSLHDSRYTLYFPFAPTNELAAEFKADLVAKDRETLTLAGQTIDWVRVGEQQPESDHGFTGSQTWVGTAIGANFRVTAGHFGYTLKARAHPDPGPIPTAVTVSYRHSQEESATEVLLNGASLGIIESPGATADESDLTATFALPTDTATAIATAGTCTITLRSPNQTPSVRVFEIRLLT